MSVDTCAASVTKYSFGKWKSFAARSRSGSYCTDSRRPDTTIFEYSRTNTHHGPPMGRQGGRRLKMDCNNPKASRDRELRVFSNSVSLLLFAVRFEFPAFNRTLAAVSQPNFRQRAILRIPCEFAGMNCSRSLLRTTGRRGEDRQVSCKSRRKLEAPWILPQSLLHLYYIYGLSMLRRFKNLRHLTKLIVYVSDIIGSNNL